MRIDNKNCLWAHPKTLKNITIILSSFLFVCNCLDFLFYKILTPDYLTLIEKRPIQPIETAEFSAQKLELIFAFISRFMVQWAQRNLRKRGTQVPIIEYISTRDTNNRVTASQAILKGIAEDGGLYVPTALPEVTLDWEVLKTQSYQEIAIEILSAFLTDFTKEEITNCVHLAYDTTFDTKEIAPVKKVGDRHFMELFHGRTIAFKDMALSILPYLLTTAAKKNQSDKEIVILTATSGDTGKAALAGFADVPHTNIIVFYPKGGVSTIQERQMVTQAGDNTFVYGVEGNFDDAQTKVKELFADKELNATLAEKGFQFSSANSINIGRLCPQIVYYVFAYAQLVKDGTLTIGSPMNVVVPTGNFGNILAAYYAKGIGVPINKLICASNENDVLVDFFQTGTYNRLREFKLTSSPSMDILVSSNLERFVFELTGRSSQETNALMTSLKENGSYSVPNTDTALFKQFYGNRANQEETAQTIHDVFKSEHYLLDPHTAVADAVYTKYKKETGDETPTVVVSTASPYKFPQSVLSALDVNTNQSDAALMDAIQQESGIAIPTAVTSVLDAPIRHTKVLSIEGMKQSVLDSLNIQ